MWDEIYSEAPPGYLPLPHPSLTRSCVASILYQGCYQPIRDVLAGMPLQTYEDAAMTTQLCASLAELSGIRVFATIGGTCESTLL